MSELKEHLFCEFDECIRENHGPLSNEMRPYYLKSEADKVIAELKAQKTRAEDDCAYWKMCHGNAVNAMNETEEYAMQLHEEARHANYKRCLAMARWCESEEKRLEAIAPLFDTDKECWEYDSDYWEKWHKRWLELAKKFKEAK